MAWRHLVSWRCSTSTTPSPTVTPSTPCMNTCTRARCLRKPRTRCVATGNYMPYERLVFSSMSDKGVTRAQIRAVVESIPSVPGLEDVLRFLENNGAEVIFISDANSVFIQDWLDAHKLSHTVRRIFTNPAHYDKDGCLQVEDYHVQDTCQLSTHNLCKGRILEEYVRERAEQGIHFSRIVYVGDGENDMCPSLRLSEKDLTFPRERFSFHKMIISNVDGHGKKIKAGVHPWSTGKDIINVLQNVVNV
uniref:Uncharacterized protein n=1 Tax=Timema douglasi TaxID=61478 RepID=A0A7R8Z6M1_TIMDO|nr:unnamed protein product [Timema douglasi]